MTDQVQLPPAFVRPTRGKNSVLNEIIPSHNKENHMTENIPQTPPVVTDEATVELKPNRFKHFVQTHPKIAKAAALTGAAVGIVVATSTAKNMQQNKAKLVEARQHAGEAVQAISDSTATPPPSEA